MRRLAVAALDSGQLYVPSGVLVNAEVEYAIEAKGSWRDACVPCHARGWGIPLFGFTARVPMEKLFRLCGCMGKNDPTAFGIGSGRKWTPDFVDLTGEDRQLFLVANDWPELRFSKNNSSIGSDPPSVTIPRLR